MDWNNDGRHTSEDHAIFHNVINAGESNSDSNKGTAAPGCGMTALVVFGIALLFFKLLSIIF